METPISYEDLLKLVSYGIFSMNFKGTSVSDDRLSKCQPIEGADYNGIYTGSPGRDVYHMLPHLTDDQMNEVAKKLSEKFPQTPPGNHVNVGAFIRFIYGQFEKKGILRSDKDFKRMKREKLEWSLSEKFIDILYKELENNNNYYGMSILCEMMAHRLGDKAVLEKDSRKLEDMEYLYNQSAEYAHKCKSYKQMFTPYYWAFRYFEKYKDDSRAKKYAILTIKEANKYCPDARPGYVTKLEDCLRYIAKHDNKKYLHFVSKYKKSKNKCVKKVFKRVNK